MEQKKSQTNGLKMLRSSPKTVKIAQQSPRVEREQRRKPQVITRSAKSFAAIVQLKLRSKVKQTKLSSSKSLSQLQAIRDDRDAISFSQVVSPLPKVKEHQEPTPEVEEQEHKDEVGSKKAIGSKYKPFKNTTLVLRDVKNSIGLRIKARHESQAFNKLTNELVTPQKSPTKLYSPFNIYSPDNSCAKDCKAKRKLNLNNNKLSDCSGAVNMNSTPKNRIALQHKKHLMLASKFTFDSPTGKLKETIKDVENFQQCIEDISKAIRERDLFN